MTNNFKVESIAKGQKFHAGGLYVSTLDRIEVCSEYNILYYGLLLKFSTFNILNRGIDPNFMLVPVKSMAFFCINTRSWSDGLFQFKRIVI